MKLTQNNIDSLSYAIIGCAIEVHKTVGPGLLESVYEKCMLREFQIKGFTTKSQQKIPIVYKGIYLDGE